MKKIIIFSSIIFNSILVYSQMVLCTKVDSNLRYIMDSTLYSKWQENVIENHIPVNLRSFNCLFIGRNIMFNNGIIDRLSYNNFLKKVEIICEKSDNIEPFKPYILQTAFFMEDNSVHIYTLYEDYYIVEVRKLEDVTTKAKFITSFKDRQLNGNENGICVITKFIENGFNIYFNDEQVFMYDKLYDYTMEVFKEEYKYTFKIEDTFKDVY